MIDEIRARVKRLTKEKGLKQVDLERAADMSHSAYNEMWARGTLTIGRMEAIAEKLGVNVIDLFQDPQVPQASITMASEPGMPYGKRRYIEDRMDAMEVEIRKLKEKTRQR